jgi:hypothetical protein
MLAFVTSGGFVKFERVVRMQFSCFFRHRLNLLLVYDL